MEQTNNQDTNARKFKGIVDLSTSTLLGIAYLVFAWNILEYPVTRISIFIASTFGYQSNLISLLIAGVMGAAGCYMLFNEPRGRRFVIGALPMMLYLGVTAMILIYEGQAPAGSAVISVLALFLLYRDFDADADKKSCEDYARKLAVDNDRLKTQVAMLRDELETRQKAGIEHAPS